MHDVPYVQDQKIGWEVIASMTRLCSEIKGVLSPRTPCGIQILASANRQALAVAKAADMQFIRAEGYVFSHIADEGFTDACAGDLLRYRKQIDAENVLVFTDLKKKHSSHSITNDVSLAETAHAAEFFMSDGIILTGKCNGKLFRKWPFVFQDVLFFWLTLDGVGTATGCAVDVNDLKSIHGKVNAPILIGSGVTSENLREYFYKSNAAIIGSYFKSGGHWSGELSEEKIAALMDKVKSLRNK